MALEDSNGDGRADVIERFGDGVWQGATGGTGIAFYKGAIYAEQNDKIVRYAFLGNCGSRSASTNTRCPPACSATMNPSCRT